MDPEVSLPAYHWLFMLLVFQWPDDDHDAASGQVITGQHSMMHGNDSTKT